MVIMKAKGFSPIRSKSFFFQLQRKENMKNLGSLKLKSPKGIGKSGWKFEGLRHGLAAKGIKTGRKKRKKKRKTNFSRGHIERAERDVLARELEKYEDHIKTPCLLTFREKDFLFSNLLQ